MRADVQVIQLGVVNARGGGVTLETNSRVGSNTATRSFGIEPANVAYVHEDGFWLLWKHWQRECSAISNFLSTGSGRGNVAKPNPPRGLKWINN
jgi:hypothetical protein